MKTPKFLRSNKKSKKSSLQKDKNGGEDTASVQGDDTSSVRNGDEEISSVKGEQEKAHLTHFSTANSSTTEKKDLKSLLVENTALKAQVEASERKLMRIVDLQNEVDSLAHLLDERESLREEMKKVYEEATEAKNNLTQAQESLFQTQATSDKLQRQVNDVTKQLQEEKNKSLCLQKQLDELQGLYRILETDRNQLNEKTESLTTDMARLCRNGKNVADVERMINEHPALVEEIDNLQAQKKRLSEEVVMTTQKLAITASKPHGNNIFSINKDSGGDALRHALAQKLELERVVKEMTESVDSKEMQIKTLKDVNKSLADQLRVYRKDVKE